MRSTVIRQAGWLFRENRVPSYQRLFQKHDGLRYWQKTPRSKVYLGIFQVTQYTTLAATLYMMTRMVLGHKTWF